MWTLTPWQVQTNLGTFTLFVCHKMFQMRLKKIQLKASLIPGGVECVMYGTVMGSLGALLAFSSRDDVDFFSHLEMHMREEHPPLWGRDHMAYRSAYFPVKDVIDGDLTPGEVLKKLEEVRNKIVKIKMRYECQKHRVTIRF
ncbi:unnamed protein product [Lactuca saligna]|uniref:RSE1/DDB1/CPSF1 C-terminal domain-containing protein n=1 Tax=Lactuca saligna TaxID=75948 RepID=A0AA35ZNP0_LACSI|nr:unnamed protein product [Lactuca saligna]